MKANIKNKREIKCALCESFFVTHIKSTPWGCRKFGFRSQILPSQLVFSSTGMKCAYFKTRIPKSPQKG